MFCCFLKRLYVFSVVLPRKSPICKINLKCAEISHLCKTYKTASSGSPALVFPERDVHLWAKTRLEMAYKIPEEQHYCLECGDPVYGRTDRKFCSNTCKNKYWNHKKWTWIGYRNRVLSILERNHDILVQLLQWHVTSMDKEDLLRLGFNFDYITAYRKVRGHHQCNCFDILYYETETRLMRISRVQGLAEFEEAEKPLPPGVKPPSSPSSGDP